MTATPVRQQTVTAILRGILPREWRLSGILQPLAARLLPADRRRFGTKGGDRP